MKRIKPALKAQPNMPKKIAALVTAALLVVSTPAVGGIAGGVAAAAESQQLNVTSQPYNINGVLSNVPSANVEGNTYIGIRVLNETLGLGTSWDPKTRSITVTGRDRTFVASPDDGSYTLNGQVIYGNPAIIENDTAYLPLRFVLERMGYGISYDHGSKTVGIDTIQENTLSIETSTINKVTQEQSLIIHYPVISGYENAESQTKVNDFLKKEAEAYAVTGQQALSQAHKDVSELEDANPDLAMPPLSFEGTYTITYNEDNRLSLYVDYYTYLGGAHGMTERVPYTFDLKTGEQLSLREAANNHENYLDIINASIREQIKERKLLLLNPFEGIASDRPFYLKHGAVVISFDQYEYTAYAEGMPEFLTSFLAFSE